VHQIIAVEEKPQKLMQFILNEILQKKDNIDGFFFPLLQ
jgi:hypothetical protein